MLRSLLSGRIELLHASLVELTGLPEKRIAGILSERAGSGLNVLVHSKPGKPKIFSSIVRTFRSPPA